MTYAAKLDVSCCGNGRKTQYACELTFLCLRLLLQDQRSIPSHPALAVNTTPPMQKEQEPKVTSKDRLTPIRHKALLTQSQPPETGHSLGVFSSHIISPYVGLLRSQDQRLRNCHPNTQKFVCRMSGLQLQSLQVQTSRFHLAVWKPFPRTPPSYNPDMEPAYMCDH